jgi:AcrR family transcriptional regulator
VDNHIRAGDERTLEDRVLDAAEALFYARGVQAVGMDEVRAASGVSLKRLYQLHSSKAELVEAYLRRRDARWRAELAAYIDGLPPEVAPRERVLAVFDWLGKWFGEQGYRGCAFVNSFGELSATLPAVTEAVRDHKDAFHGYLAGLADAAGAPPWLAGQLALLAEGAMSAAAITGTASPARDAREAAAVLLDRAIGQGAGQGHDQGEETAR